MDAEEDGTTVLFVPEILLCTPASVFLHPPICAGGGGGGAFPSITASHTGSLLVLAQEELLLLMVDVPASTALRLAA